MGGTARDREPGEHAGHERCQYPEDLQVNLDICEDDMAGLQRTVVTDV